MENTNYVEVIGVPGAGKTHFTRLLTRMCNEKGIEAISRNPLGKNIVLRIFLFLKMCLTILSRPLLWRVLFLGIRKEYREVLHARDVVRNLKVRLVWEVVVLSYLRGREKEKIIVHDEGIVGRVVALRVLAETNDDLLKVLLKTFLPKGTQIIYISISKDRAIQQESERGVILPFFSDNTEEVKRTYYEQSAQQYQSIGDLFPVKILDNDKSQGDLSKEVLDIIDTTIKSRSI